MTELESLWLQRLQHVADRAAHEVKDALNGVALNLEVVRSRTAAAEAPAVAVGPFAAAAADQLETLNRRVQALLFLARPSRDPVDVGQNLRHFAELMVPVARSDGGELVVEGMDLHAPTSANGTAVRLALAEGILGAAAPGKRGRCELTVTGEDAVVRFSHESARTLELDPACARALAGQGIRNERSDERLLLVFPR